MMSYLAKMEWSWVIPIIKAGLLMIGGYFISRMVSRAIHKFTNKHTSAQQAMILEKTSHITVLLLFFISALQQLHFELSVLLGSAGILTAAVGFAAKSSISNIISGVFLIVEKSFEVNDTIRVNNISGVVKSIDFLSVKIRTDDGTLVRIPNENILNSEVINLTHYHTRRIDIRLGIAYDQDIAPVKAALLSLATLNNRTIKKPAPTVTVTEFGESSVNLLFSVYAARDDFSSLKAELFEQVKTLFDEHHFEMPYPQLTIHQSEGKV